MNNKIQCPNCEHSFELDKASDHEKIEKTTFAFEKYVS